MGAKSRWYVITGGFSSGKTTVCNLLEEMNYGVVPNAARVLIDEGLEKGIPVEETRKSEGEFQREVLARKLRDERRLLRNQITFLDNAVPCSIPYFALNEVDPQEALRFCERGLYAGVFLMDQLPYEHDYARTETEEFMLKLNGELRMAYTNLGYEVIKIPVVSPEERVRLILAHV
ncbi:MAG: hypothetical protein G01um101420_646 [Parcubacteria group bacterium Gr01-1014_20]|nr:MAG: hypothetical protein G01um101420_646 [Parcubacteria group bacterium Gr01-1014_20]